MSQQNISTKKDMNQNVLKIFRNFCPEFLGPGELCQFEPQENKKGKVIKFKPSSIYPEIFKSISLIVIENLPIRDICGVIWLLACLFVVVWFFF